jgi:serralysin
LPGSIGNPGASWHIKATGDFNGDGFADILWQNDDGSVAIWEMDGTSMIGGAIVANPGASWHAVGTGDFNHDGHADILWQSSDGSVAV